MEPGTRNYRTNHIIVQELNASVSKKAESFQPLQWVSEYGDYLFHFALKRIQCEEMARDLVQDTFLAALENEGSFEKRSSEKTWLTAILKNKIFDLYRKQTKRHSEKEKIMDHFFRLSDGHWQPEHVPSVTGKIHPLEAKEYQKLLAECIKKLPRTWLPVFTMKLMEEYSTEVVCRQLNITHANFWVIIHRAKLNLRACLEKNQ